MTQLECAVIAVPGEVTTNRIKAFVVERDGPSQVVRPAPTRLHDPLGVRVPGGPAQDIDREDGQAGALHSPPSKPTWRV